MRTPALAVVGTVMGAVLLLVGVLLVAWVPALDRRVRNGPAFTQQQVLRTATQRQATFTLPARLGFWQVWAEWPGVAGLSKVEAAKASKSVAFVVRMPILPEPNAFEGRDDPWCMGDRICLTTTIFSVDEGETPVAVSLGPEYAWPAEVTLGIRPNRPGGDDLMESALWRSGKPLMLGVGGLCGLVGLLVLALSAAWWWRGARKAP